MKRIAILGGGISGLTAAYELEKARRNGAAIDWHLYEASDRLGGIIQTSRIATPEGDYILEGGPDGWVTEKPWATEFCNELGLANEIIYSNDATRVTYILNNGRLLPIPDHMRLMVPTDLAALDHSPLFSSAAKAAYAAEPARAAELKASTPDHDESIASFVLRHFGEEVLNTLAAPLLSGVFGGDVHKLSVRAIMPQFVAMEREHGSLILALQQAAANRTTEPKPIFTSLRHGVETLTEALTAQLPAGRIHLSAPVKELRHYDEEFYLDVNTPTGKNATAGAFDHLVFALPIDVIRRLGVAVVDELFRAPSGRFLKLAPTDASSAILAAFAWPPELAAQFTIPAGFGYLVPAPPQPGAPGPDSRTRAATEPQLLAATFVNQKFPHRTPTGARILRAFFGGAAADQLATATDDAIAHAALTQLRNTLGPIPDPTHTTVRHLPHSLPQYEVGHPGRMTELEFQLSRGLGFTLLGNAYRGVGLPDLIRDARSTARSLARLSTTA